MPTVNPDPPVFESLSPSGRYAELTEYCVARLTGWIDSLFEEDGDSEQTLPAQEVLIRIRHSLPVLRNSYGVELQRLFNDFKAIRPARHFSNTRGKRHDAGLFDARLSRINPAILAEESRLLPLLEARLRMLDRRMKYLVHRSDEGLDDNPLFPFNLLYTFAAAIGDLGLAREQTLDLIKLHGRQLERQLPGFCRDCDWALSEMGICFELPFEENPTLSAADEVSSVKNPLAPEVDSGDETDLDAEHCSSESTEAAVPHLRIIEPGSSHKKPEEDARGTPGTVSESTKPENQPGVSGGEPKTELRDDPRPGITPVNGMRDEWAEAATVAQPEERVGAPVLETIDGLRRICIAGATAEEFHRCVEQLLDRVDERMEGDLRKFVRFYSGLINNPHVGSPLRQQLLRLAAPLLYLVMTDPFFFRSSNHPVNDFLHSMIDFEIRYGHRPHNLKVLALLVDNLLRLKEPSLSDFHPITQGYEAFRIRETERLKKEKIRKTGL